MAIISKSRFNQKEKLRLEISCDVLRKIEAYCQWAGIDDPSYFVEEAACYVFSKDKEFKAFQKQLKKTERVS